MLSLRLIRYGKRFIFEVTAVVNVVVENRPRITAFQVPFAAGPEPGESVSVPQYLDAMIGREAELAAAIKLLRRSRVVTVYGPGGIGKTRFAIELGRRVGSQFQGGVKFIDVLALKDAAAVADATLKVLGAKRRGSMATIGAIVSKLAGQLPTLLVYDGCDELVEEVGDLITAMLGRSRDVAVLATSQRRLKLLTGTIYQLKGMALPPPEATAVPLGSALRIADFDAVMLFHEHARSADHRFELTDRNARGVAEICRRFGGNPLAIQLAAFRVPALRIDGLCARLDRALNLFTAGSPNWAPRHRTLRGMLDWSYDRLDSAEQRALCRFGIFPASFTVGEAIAVARAGGVRPANTSGIVARLVDNSIIRAEGGPGPRYRMNEMLQIYAVEKLKAGGEYEMIALCLAQYLVELGARAGTAWETMPETEWLGLYRPEIDNIQMALNWVLAKPERASLAIDLAGAVGHLMERSGLAAEGRRSIDKAVALLTPDTPAAASAPLLKSAGLLWRGVDRRRGLALLEQSAVLYRQLGDQPNLGPVLAVIGADHVYLGHFQEAGAVLSEAEALLSPRDQAKSLLEVMSVRGALALAADNPAEAGRYFARARDQARRLNDGLREHVSVLGTSEVEFRQGAVDRAIYLARETAGGLRAAGQRSALGRALVKLATFLMIRGDHAEARSCAEESLSLVSEEGGYWLRLCLQLWALIGAREERYTIAGRVIGHVDAEYCRTGEIRGETERQILGLLTRLLAANLSQDDIRVWGEEGAAWNESRAIEFVLERLVPPKSKGIWW
jgi:predicted ATPase